MSPKYTWSANGAPTHVVSQIEICTLDTIFGKRSFGNFSSLVLVEMVPKGSTLLLKLGAFNLSGKWH